MRRTELSELLLPGEVLGEQVSVTPGGAQELYGYNVYQVASPEDALGSNAVFFDITSGGETEWEHTVRKDQTLHVHARAGRGQTEMYLPDGHYRVHPLGPGQDPAKIPAGTTYRHLNDGEYGEPLVLHDRSWPEWSPEDEIPVEESSLEAELRDDAFVAIWNPVHPRSRTAGILRLTILGDHDTTAENMRRAGHSKYRGDDPHKHAIAEWAGKEGKWPVKVYDRQRRLYVAAHRLGHDAIVGTPPDFTIQDDAVIFVRPSRTS